ncbi:MAG: hypothetical protein PHR98_01205 [Candidatus Shapirobacteria bacterium]|jgi:hypothetical protein|nr:hypothetical protein [Candidatus Shapirobacteria bacterium]
MTTENKSITKDAIVNERDYPLYDQAAQLQGVHIYIKASSGKFFYLTETGLFTKLSSSKIAISLRRDYTQDDKDGFQDFFKTVEIIKAELPNTRLG